MNIAPKKSDSKINIDTYRQMYSAIERSRIKFDPQLFNVIEGTNGTFVSMVPTSDLSIPEEFGIREITSNTITVYGGIISIGDDEKYTASETTITVTASSYIGWEIDVAGNSISIVNFGASRPIQSTGYHRKSLWYATATGSAITLSVDTHKSEVYPIAKKLDPNPEDTSDGTWYFKEMDVVTDVRFYDDKIQMKKRNIKVYVNDDIPETDWITITTATPCT